MIPSSMASCEKNGHSRSEGRGCGSQCRIPFLLQKIKKILALQTITMYYLYVILYNNSNVQIRNILKKSGIAFEVHSQLV